MRHGCFLSMQLRYRWGLALLVLHILVLSITAAPHRKLARKQDTTATKGDDVSFGKKEKKRTVFSMLSMYFYIIMYSTFNQISKINHTGRHFQASPRPRAFGWPHHLHQYCSDC